MRRLAVILLSLLAVAACKHKVQPPQSQFGVTGVPIPDGCTNLHVMVDMGMGIYTIRCTYELDGEYRAFFAGPIHLQGMEDRD